MYVQDIYVVEIQKWIIKAKTYNSHCIVQQFNNEKQFVTECLDWESNKHKEAVFVVVVDVFSQANTIYPNVLSHLHSYLWALKKDPIL